MQPQKDCAVGPGEISIQQHWEQNGFCFIQDNELTRAHKVTVGASITAVAITCSPFYSEYLWPVKAPWLLEVLAKVQMFASASMRETLIQYSRG